MPHDCAMAHARFAGRDPEAREKTALRIIALSFFGLAAYVTVEAVRSFLGLGEARHSTIGIVLAATSLGIMPVLSYAQRRAGRELGSLSAGRFQTDAVVHLFVCGAACRSDAQQPVWLVVGRPGRCFGDRRDRRQGRRPCVERRCVLCTAAAWIGRQIG